MKNESVDKFDINIFSLRELEVLACITNGHSYKAAALILKISDRTVNTYMRNICIKIGVTTKEQIICVLRDAGVVEEIRERFSKTKNINPRNIESEKIVHGTDKGTSKTQMGMVLIVVSLLAYGTWHLFYQKKSAKIITSGVVINNDTYIDRKKITIELNCFLKPNDSINVVALIGDGGAGKTTISRRHLQEKGYDFAYEINAEDTASVAESMIGLAHILAKTEEQRKDLKYILNINIYKEKEKQILLFILSRLKEISNWCLLFDNVEDFEILKRFCPKNKELQGNVIITTRNGEIQNVSYLGKMKHIMVDELTDDEKKDLFNVILGSKNRWNAHEIDCFLKQLPGFPLDISTAAYYLKNIDVTLNDYVKLLKSIGDGFLKLNGKFMFEYNDYNKTRYGIIASTLKNIVEQNSKFKDILFFIFLMDSQKLPIKLLKAAYDKELVNELLFCLEKYFIVTKEGETISIHRKTQHMGLHYICEIIAENERNNSLEKILKVLTPYEKTNKEYTNLRQFTPHLRAFLTHLEEFDIEEDKKNKFRINLLVTIGNIYKEKERSIDESVSYFQEALDLHNKHHIFNEPEAAKIILSLGDALVLLNRNSEAEKYLNASLDVLKKINTTDYSNNLRLLGILNMRRDNFDEANRCFDTAITFLNKNTDFEASIVKARTYAAKSLNYVNRYINKSEMNEAINLMRKAINILENRTSAITLEKNILTRELADLKITLSGMENGIMRHEDALVLAKETEELLNQLPDEDNVSYCSLGKIYTEKGHAYLRMNKLDEAKAMFIQARKVCDKAQVNEYVWRTRMQQTETLVRLGKLEEAYKNCEYMFNLNERDINIGADLFYNTSYYHAAVIKYRMGEISKSLEHFHNFSVSMKDFCKEFLKQKDYEKLLHEGVFEIISNESEIKKCFENAFKIFSSICMKGSGFITDYVQQNLLNL